jgi:uncharacterized protein (DUF433 family)
MGNDETAVVAHPYVAKSPDVQGGQACVKGTRMTVASLWARYDLHGQSPREIAAQFPHLSLARILDALSYAAEHEEEMRRDLEADNDG